MKHTNTYLKLHVVILLFICLTAVISFYPTFSNGFQMKWDDQWMVFNSQTVGNPSIHLLYLIFTEPSHGQLAPVNQLMYTLLYQCFGLNPLPYHVICLLLHIANICLLYYGLSMILSDCTRMTLNQIRKIAAITTLLFAIHPLQVESIAWVSASKIPLSTAFYFSGTLMLIKYFRKKSYCWYIGALLMQLLSYLSKEQAVVFPLFATLLYFWYSIYPRTKRFWIGLFPFYLLGLASVIHEVFYVANYDQYVQGETYVWWQRLIFCVYSVVTYFFKWITPVNLNWMYLFPIGIRENMPWWLVLYPVFSIFLIFVSWTWIKKPLVASLLAFFIIHLLLVIHITALPRASVIADRYLYVPIISLNFMFAYLITKLDVLLCRPKLQCFILSIVISVFMGTSFSRVKDWKDSEVLRTTIRVKRVPQMKLNDSV